ncbi:MAG: DUF3307 domain-containing protein, partial [Acholeplasmataceae bacterium]|nr:DUF3307 domain-containing protein [Acholeplasmataceae bacterium]
MAFLLILIAHILGDFTFQPGALVLAKNRKWTYLLVHALIYTVPAVILMFSFLRSWVVLLYAPLIFL